MGVPSMGWQLSKQSAPNLMKNGLHHWPNHNIESISIMQSTLYECHKRQTTLHWGWMGVIHDWELGMGAKDEVAVGKTICPKSHEKWLAPLAKSQQ